MARKKLPDPLARRHLLEGNLDPAKAAAIGQAYLEADREVEAVDFLARGEQSETLETLRATAIERGDVFLVRLVSGALDEELDAATWRRVGEAARAGGRVRDAETAARLATVES